MRWRVFKCVCLTILSVAHTELLQQSIRSENSTGCTVVTTVLCASK